MSPSNLFDMVIQMEKGLVSPFFTTASASNFFSLNGTALAVIGGGSIAALAAALSLTDPERRRKQQAEEVGGDDKEVVKEYFNSIGFQRWKKIYGETDDVNRVQLDIRLGHSKTVENTLKMLKDEGSLKGVTVCDAGCGTGSLSIVSTSDISAAMVAEAEKNSKADDMIAHLSSLAENRLILSFAPKTFYYNLLKRIGELFPGPSKATRAYLHSEADVERALKTVGWRIRKRGLITTHLLQIMTRSKRFKDGGGSNRMEKGLVTGGMGMIKNRTILVHAVCFFC